MTLENKFAVERAALYRDRAATRARLAALSATFDDILRSTDSANIDDEHDPEGTTIAFERAQISSLVAAARRRLDELDAATARMDVGTYGRCVECGGRIAAERLAILPATGLCVECAASRH